MVGFRLLTNGLAARTAARRPAVRNAAWAGCQDSMPRAAILSLHARLSGVTGSVLERSDLTQVWGPGFSAYVVATDDVAVFTLGRLPETGQRRSAAFEMAEALEPILAAGPVTYRDAGERLGVNPNQLRYAALTGTVALHWAGSGPPEISALPTPTVDASGARLELARRFLHVFGPATSDDFASWAGVPKGHAAAVFDALAEELTPVAAPGGPALILRRDVAALEASGDASVEGVRLLPSGDTLYLLRGRQREVLVAKASHRSQLWTPRVWPGAVLVDGAIVGTWRRSGSTLTVSPWRRLSKDEKERVGREAADLPLPEPVRDIRWDNA